LPTEGKEQTPGKTQYHNEEEKKGGEGEPLFSVTGGRKNSSTIPLSVLTNEEKETQEKTVLERKERKEERKSSIYSRKRKKTKGAILLISSM